MIALRSLPEFTLSTEVAMLPDRGEPVGRWQFSLRDLRTGESLEAADTEFGITADRLRLLTAVRGLEELEQPSSVRLACDAPYVVEGLRYGLAEWRANGWLWERFEDLVPIAHADLWRRLDGILRYHEVRAQLAPADTAPRAAASGVRPRGFAEPQNLLHRAGRFVRRWARAAAVIAPI